MVRAGFSAILIDRYGYEDGGAEVIAAVRAVLGYAQPLAESARYVAYDIRSLQGAAEDALSVPPAAPASPPAKCTAPPAISIDQVGGQAPPPLGTALEISRSGPLRVMGWAVDPASKGPGSRVEIVIDATAYPAIYGLDRPDVADFFRTSAYHQSGFAFEIAAGKVGDGSRTLSVRVTSADGECVYSSTPIGIVVD
jgi:hypothetical protein